MGKGLSLINFWQIKLFCYGSRTLYRTKLVRSYPLSGQVPKQRVDKEVGKQEIWDLRKVEMADLHDKGLTLRYMLWWNWPGFAHPFQVWGNCGVMSMMSIVGGWIWVLEWRHQAQKVADAILDAGEDFGGVEFPKDLLTKWVEVVVEWSDVSCAQWIESDGSRFKVPRKNFGVDSPIAPTIRNLIAIIS